MDIKEHWKIMDKYITSNFLMNKYDQLIKDTKIVYAVFNYIEKDIIDNKESNIDIYNEYLKVELKLQNVLKALESAKQQLVDYYGINE